MFLIFFKISLVWYLFLNFPTLIFDYFDICILIVIYFFNELFNFLSLNKFYYLLNLEYFFKYEIIGSSMQKCFRILKMPLGSSAGVGSGVDLKVKK